MFFHIFFYLLYYCRWQSHQISKFFEFFWKIAVYCYIMIRDSLVKHWFYKFHITACHFQIHIASFTGVPVSACFRAKAICPSVNLLLLMSFDPFLSVWLYWKTNIMSGSVFGGKVISIKCTGGKSKRNVDKYRFLFHQNSIFIWF